MESDSNDGNPPCDCKGVQIRCEAEFKIRCAIDYTTTF